MPNCARREVVPYCGNALAAGTQTIIVSRQFRVKIALLTTDNREHQRTYGEATPRFGPAIEAVLAGLYRLADLEIHVVACTQRPMPAPKQLSENAWFHLLHVPKIGWLRTGYQGCIRAIRGKLREIGPDLVHGQGTERECALSAVLSGFPSVVTIHGNMRALARDMRARTGSYLWCAAQIERFTLPRAGGVLCNSLYTETLIRSRKSRIWRVPNAIRLPFFDVPLPERQVTDPPILLNVGVVAPYKRQLAMLNLAQKLHQEGCRFTLQFVGSADPRSTYARTFLRRIEAAGEEGYARYLGQMNLVSLLQKLDGARGLIHFPTEEAFGLVVAEALARNLKVFGARVGGVPDIIRGVEDAELIESEEDLAAAIRRWLKGGCPQPKSAGAEMRRRYHPNVVAGRHLEIYREVLRGV